ncbi:MAG: hypothetical protein KDC39_08795 [Actinobacteria bacterium]|nr:hypothetical protein [Actinomycetota bacterium]
MSKNNEMNETEASQGLSKKAVAFTAAGAIAAAVAIPAVGIATHSSAAEQSPQSSAAQTDTAVSGAKQAQHYAKKEMKDKYGWGNKQYQDLVLLWNKESGWNVKASNSSSGAYGIAQALPGSKMSSAGKDWKSNAKTQVDWGLKYIKDRYGSPSAAWSHSQNTGWY